MKPEYIIAAAIIAAASGGHSSRVYDLIDCFQKALQTIQEEMPDSQEAPHVRPTAA